VTRVALVSPYALDRFGGVQSQVLGLSAALRAAGIEVAVIAPFGEPAHPPPDGLIAVGAPISVRANGSQAPIAPYPAAWHRARAALKAFGPDVIHLHEPLVPGPCLAILMAQTPAPKVGTFHRAEAGWLYPLFRPVFSPLAARLDLRVAVSPAASATARRALGARHEPTMVLANAVDVDRFRAAPRRASEGPTLAFLGRHEPRKGLEVLLRAMAQLPHNVRLWVVGEGTHTDALRARFDDPRISWLGALDDETAAETLAGADVFVAPSLGGESFGVVLLEAMAASTAIVASDIPGYRLVADGAARFFTPGDADALASTVLALLGDPSSRNRLVEEGRRRAELHSFSALGAAYLEWYERLLRSSRTT
jgi:phosphatidylinositol alpha-mannosyltransferase